MLYPESNRLERDEALRLWTRGSAWFSSEEDRKGALAPGQLADLTVLSKDYFSVPEAEIQTIESVLTIVGGEVVYAAQDFAKLAPPLPPVSPAWSPVARYGGASQPHPLPAAHAHAGHHLHDHLHAAQGLGCDCFVG